MTRAIRSRTSGQMNTAPVRARLLEILTSPSSPVRVLRLMNESGYLGKLLPDFGRIVGMMQFDMYHSYTVDEHTIQVVGMMHAIEVGDLKEEAPLASQMIHETHSRRALYMATFLHDDIAKGRGGDHSVLGLKWRAACARSLGWMRKKPKRLSGWCAGICCFPRLPFVMI